jgi:hypothetical protein
MKKETKKQGAKLSKKENETLNKVYTIEDLKKDFLEANSDLLQLSKNIGCKYAPAHKNFDLSPAPGKRTRIQLIVDGVTSTYDKVKLQELTGTYNPKTTPKTGDRATSKYPETLRAKAAMLRAKAEELESQANEIDAANAAKAASVAKINEAAKGLKVDGLTAEEQKQLLKVLKMQLANA